LAPAKSGIGAPAGSPPTLDPFAAFVREVAGELDPLTAG
jgi:hypothetical protein